MAFCADAPDPLCGFGERSFSFMDCQLKNSTIPEKQEKKEREII